MSLPAILIQDGRPMADSRDVAAAFDREHKVVLRSYRNLECSDDFRRRNFAPFKIKDLTGESLSHVLMTKNGFSFLVLGFTGAAAAVFKEQYIERFDAMETALRQPAAPVLPQTLPEALRLAADLAEKVQRQERAIAVLEPRSNALATIAEGVGSFCIRDAAKLLQMVETGLRGYLASNRWIYKREAGGEWVPFAERERQGWMTTKVIPVDTGTGKPWNKPQARITCAGLTILAQRFGKPVPPEAMTPLPLIEYAPARAS